MLRKLVYSSGIFIGIVTLMFFSFWVYDWCHRPEQVASILNIDSPPDSIHSIRCKSYFTSDVITECTFQIDPDEFSMLLAGYNFQKKKRLAKSLTLTHMVKEDFSVTYEFFAEPEEFKYGGYIKVYSNAEYSKVIIDLFIE